MEIAATDIRQLCGELYRERVLRARRQDPQSKLRAGPELFDMACQVTLAGIRQQRPGLSEPETLQILKDRLKWRRQREWNVRS